LYVTEKRIMTKAVAQMMGTERACNKATTKCLPLKYATEINPQAAWPNCKM
jgi:hypothetical protein